MANGDRKTFKGSLFYYRPAPHVAWLRPIRWLKEMLEQLQMLIQDLMWAELIHGEVRSDSFSTLLLFGIFCILSLGEYYQNVGIGLAALLVGLFDRGEKLWLQSRYQQSQNYSATALTSSDDSCRWSLAAPDGYAVRKAFSKADVLQVFISYRSIRGGSFNQEIAAVWRVSLFLTRQRELTIDEHERPTPAWQQARELARELQVPLNVLNSENAGDATRQLQRSASSFVQCRQSASGLEIYTRWTVQNSWKLLGAVLNQAGLLLFVALLSGFMYGFGGLIANFFGWENTLDLQSLWTLRPSHGMLLPMAVAVGLLVVEAAKISRPKRLTLDRETLTITTNGEPPVSLPRRSIQTCLMLNQPRPMVVIFTEDRGVLIDSLVDTQDYRLLLQALTDELEQP